MSPAAQAASLGKDGGGIMDAASVQNRLRQLAEAYGVEPGYHDDQRRWHDAGPPGDP